MFKPLLFAYSDVRDRRDVWSPARARVPGVIVSDQDQDQDPTGDDIADPVHRARATSSGASRGRRTGEPMNRLVEASRQYQVALEHRRRGATENASADELVECEEATEELRQRVIDLIVDDWSATNL